MECKISYEFWLTKKNYYLCPHCKIIICEHTFFQNVYNDNPNKIWNSMQIEKIKKKNKRLTTILIELSVEYRMGYYNKR